MSVIAATAVSDCPTPTVSTITTSNPAASTIRIVSRVRRATPPSDTPDGVGRMYARGIDREALHPGLVAEDRSAAHGGRRVDGEHRHLVPAVDEKGAERLDERRLPDPGRSGQPDAQGLARSLRQTLQEIGRGRLVIGTGGLDEGDRPRDGPPIRTSDTALEPGRVDHSNSRMGWSTAS